MPMDKKPFHEVLAGLLVTAPLGLMSKSKWARAGELSQLLDILYMSKMPAVAACRIAQDNAGLPAMLVEAGLRSLAERTTEVLADLKSRNPPRCFQCGSVTALRAADCPGDPKVLKDFPYSCGNGCTPSFQAQFPGLIGRVYFEE